jgi:hypothetical protein
MLTKTTFALAIIIGTASGALAENNQHSAAPGHGVYEARGKYVGSDPDPNVRHEMRRDSGREQAN